MKAQVRKAVQLGELIVAIFDLAGRYSKNRQEVSRLAILTLDHMIVARTSGRARHLRRFEG